MSSLAKHGIASGLFLFFSIIFYLESLKLPETAARLPQLLIVIIIILSIAMFIESVIKPKKMAASNNDFVQNIAVKRVFLFAVFIALYIFLIDTIGYFIVTPIFVIVAFIYLKAAKLKTVIFIAVGFTAFIYALFVMFLKIPVPMGLLSL